MSRLSNRHALPKQTGSRHAGPLAGRAWLSLALIAAAGSMTGAAHAQANDAQQAAMRQRMLAATCSHCHGTDGRAVEGEPFVRLAGRPADELLAQLMAFRNGQRQATVMHQIAKGYTPEQLQSLAQFFAAQK